jgi:hypothetical protein
MLKHLPALLIAIALSACGGGGSSAPAPGAAPGTPSAPVPAPSPAPAAAVSFAPAKLSASFASGTSKSVTVTATVNRPADFDGAATVYVYIVDSAGVILPAATRIDRPSNTQFNATLNTAATLVPGTYTGNFVLQLCRDAACAAQFPGSPVLLPYEFTVVAPGLAQITASPNLPLSASVRLGASATVQAVVTVKAEGRTWSAAANAAWVKLETPAGTNSGSFRVSFDAAGLAVGTYRADITVKSNDGQSVVLPAILTVMQTAFQVEGSSVGFNAVNGAPIPPRTLQFTLDNAVPSPWSASSDSTWLSASPSSGVTPATSTLSINPASMASGNYNAILTLKSPVSSPRAVSVNLSLTPATLSLSANSVTLGGNYGRTFADAAVTMNLNTQGNRWPWTLSAPPAWVKPGALSGTVDQTGTSLTFTPDAAAAPLGTSTAALNLAATVNGDAPKQALTVTIHKDQRKLLAAETGVAFSSTPQWSRLSRTIKISDNFGIDAGWSASSDRAWLSVTAGGRTPGGAGTLILSANPAALPDDQVSYATVTLASSAAGVIAPETIRVALWKGTVTPQAKLTVAQAYTNVVTDPIRPFAYLHNSAASIDVYNVYTGIKIATLASLGAALGDMAISPNGDTLYVFDTTNRNIVLVDLASLAKRGSWPLATSVDKSTRMLAMRPNGVNIVVTSTNGSYLASTGASLGGPRLGGEIGASGDSRRLFVNSSSAYSVDYSEMLGGMLVFARYASLAPSTSQGSAGAVSANLDGTRVYTANGAPYRCTGYSGDNGSEIGFLPGGDAYPNNVKVASDGRIFCGIFGWYSSADVWVHRPDGSLQTSFKFAGYAQALLTRQMAVSGDALMMVALTDDPRLVFVPVGP